MDLLVRSRRRSRGSLPGLVAAIGSLLILVVMSARADWPNTNATKFVQLPDISTNGMDIDLGNFPLVLGDDFVCTNTGPITDIHLWLSSLQNVPVTGAQFELGIWTDVAFDPTTGIPSHPGLRLWHEIFGPGEYAIVTAATNLHEQFWSLDPVPQFMGPDNTLFLYNFFPKQPYTQTGSTANPQIYWLTVSMTGNDPPQGWKTSTNGFAPDFAVLGHYDATGTNVTDWRTLFDPRLPTAGLNFSFALTTRATNPPPTQCVDTNTAKFLQPPKIDGGWDVWDSGPYVLADDFICTNTGPITDIHVWGSWLNDVADPNPTFWLGIYDDVAAVTNGPVIIPSRPGTNLLWQQWFGPGQYAQQPAGAGIEQFLDPGAVAIMGADSQAYYYCFYPTNPLVQTGAPGQPKMYWLALYAQPANGPANLFGWKSSILQQFDISTHTPWGGAPPITTAWTPTRDPNGIPLDLAFKITTQTNEPPPSPCCPDTNDVKYVQRPRIFDGLDVKASQNLVLADDFRCTDTGPITDIHLWGSWLQDAIDPNAVFTLSIWSDVPAITNGPAPIPSHPGVVLWSQQFGSNQYYQCLFTNISEQFYDPSLPAILGPDTKMYYLCFYPTNPLVQQGTAAAPTNYWLAVNVQMPAGSPFLFGWHSSSDAYNDVAVWGPGPGFPAAWTPMYDPANQPLSMAFKVTTHTNGCPPPTLICAPAKTVECGTNWTFDPPTVVDPCCPTPPTPTLTSVVTNGFCPQVLTATWTVADCRGMVATCTSIVMVADTTAPTLTCATNKTVECGTTWTFDPPTASDTCCSNVEVTVFRTITNGLCPQFIVRTWVARDCCGNTNVCSQTVTVVDTTPPILTCATNKTVECGTTWTFDAPTAFDACCPNVDVSVFSTLTNGVCPQFIIRTWVAKDCCGNTNTCRQMVTVVDTTPPTLTCAPNKTVDCGAPWTFDPPAAFDLCCSNVDVNVLSTLTNGLCPMAVTRTWIARDCCGNTNTCSQTVTVISTAPPTLTCATNKTVECGTPWTFDPPTVSSPCCGTNYTLLVVGTLTNGVPCAQQISRSWMALDCCDRTSTTCTQTVTVVDTLPPSLVCPSNIVVETCDTNVIVTWTVTATDNCSTNITITSTPPSGSSFKRDSATHVHVVATDPCGNTNTCDFVVVVHRPRVVIVLNPGAHSITLTWDFGVLQEADNVLGPYTDVPLAVSPYTTPVTPPRKFYRLRCP